MPTQKELACSDRLLLSKINKLEKVAEKTEAQAADLEAYKVEAVRRKIIEAPAPAPEVPPTPEA